MVKGPADLLDGTGLDPYSLALAASGIGGPVHARVTSRAPGAYPSTACGSGLGQWWTGIAAEVTCRVCRAWLDQRTTSA